MKKPKTKVFFHFFLLNRNKMQPQCNFVFSFYERKEGKEKQRKQSNITETQQRTGSII
jgi:hypothetical protein